MTRPTRPVAIPEGVYLFVIEMDQGCPDQCGQPHLFQRDMPIDEGIEQLLDVPAVLGRLVAATVGLVTHVGNTVFWIVSNRSGAVVRMGDVLGDQAVRLKDEFPVQGPAGRARGTL
jgi:hypothetical protein